VKNQKLNHDLKKVFQNKILKIDNYVQKQFVVQPLFNQKMPTKTIELSM
jgi:hypothetical protein